MAISPTPSTLPINALVDPNSGTSGAGVANTGTVDPTQAGYLTDGFGNRNAEVSFPTWNIQPPANLPDINDPKLTAAQRKKLILEFANSDWMNTAQAGYTVNAGRVNIPGVGSVEAPPVGGITFVRPPNLPGEVYSLSRGSDGRAYLSQVPVDPAMLQWEQQFKTGVGPGAGQLPTGSPVPSDSVFYGGAMGGGGIRVDTDANGVPKLDNGIPKSGDIFPAGIQQNPGYTLPDGTDLNASQIADLKAGKQIKVKGNSGRKFKLKLNADSSLHFEMTKRRKWLKVWGMAGMIAASVFSMGAALGVFTVAQGIVTGVNLGITGVNAGVAIKNKRWASLAMAGVSAFAGGASLAAGQASHVARTASQVQTWAQLGYGGYNSTKAIQNGDLVGGIAGLAAAGAAGVNLGARSWNIDPAVAKTADRIALGAQTARQAQDARRGNFGDIAALVMGGIVLGQVGGWIPGSPTNPTGRGGTSGTGEGQERLQTLEERRAEADQEQAALQRAAGQQRIAEWEADQRARGVKTTTPTTTRPSQTGVSRTETVALRRPPIKV